MPRHPNRGDFLKTTARTAGASAAVGLWSSTDLLGNVAFRSGKTLEWDLEHLKAGHAPEADPFIRRPYRAG